MVCFSCMFVAAAWSGYRLVGRCPLHYGCFVIIIRCFAILIYFFKDTRSKRNILDTMTFILKLKLWDKHVNFEEVLLFPVIIVK